ncbi:MAG: SpoIIE family protein phosphatase [Acetobacteraceae bacterium]|nr:SpoIIE family protein phosphatase [Acetobacteraceae bacterium]
MTDLPEDEDFLLLADDDEEGATADERAGVPWVVLVVDDDPDVHTVSRMALDGIHFLGRRLEILDCYSGQQACALLASRQDIAVMFLDVVMETDDAGLKVARYVREQLGNRNTRIVLRTGQPGQAPEQSVIIDYDINDYKSKTELTAQKLFTTLITALRSYGDLLSIAASRDGLRQIGNVSAQLFRIRAPRDFMEQTLAGLMEFVSGERGAIFCREPEGNGYSRVLLPLAMQGWSVESEAELLRRVQEISERRHSEAADDHSFLYVRTPNERELVIYLYHPQPIDLIRRDLLSHFVDKVAIGYDNVLMHEWQAQTNHWLEEQVQERTRELSEKTVRLEDAHRKIADELKLAHILQQAILPPPLPCDSRFQLTATMRPAREVGGDFYHMLRLDDDRVAFLIADVSGKGVTAAFFMLRAYSILHQIATSGAAPAECLTRANAELCEANPLLLFVTLFFAICDVRKRTITYATAGHDMPYLLRADGTSLSLPRAGGMLLGTFEQASFTEASFDLLPGDRLFLFTDGFTEAMNDAGDFFGETRLMESLLQARALPVDDMVQAVIADVQAFAGAQPQADDVTCVLLDLGYASFDD